MVRLGVAVLPHVEEWTSRVIVCIFMAQSSEAESEGSCHLGWTFSESSLRPIMALQRLFHLRAPRK
jgi:hypothetical protein